MVEGHGHIWNPVAADKIKPHVYEYEPGGSVQRVIDMLATSGYTATTDFPACVLYAQFLKAYPEAKVILSVRTSAKKWSTSVLNTIARIGGAARKFPASKLLQFKTGGSFGEMDEWMWGSIGVFRNSVTMDMEAADLDSAYQNWIDDVKKTVPSDKLLIHTAAEGYAPMCAFLEIENCPTEPYPHMNDGAILSFVATSLETLNSHWPLLGVALLLLLVGLLRCCRPSSSSSARPKTN
jgi:hypothetical protein